MNRNRNSVAAYAGLESQVSNQFTMDIAGRYENFSDFGGTFNGKLAMRYEFTPAIALRGAVSTGFRAPSLNQLWFNNVSTQFVLDPQTNELVPARVLTGNNKDPVTKGVRRARPQGGDFGQPVGWAGLAADEQPLGHGGRLLHRHQGPDRPVQPFLEQRSDDRGRREGHPGPRSRRSACPRRSSSRERGGHADVRCRHRRELRDAVARWIARSDRIGELHRYGGAIDQRRAVDQGPVPAGKLRGHREGPVQS